MVVARVEKHLRPCSHPGCRRPRLLGERTCFDHLDIAELERAIADPDDDEKGGEKKKQLVREKRRAALARPDVREKMRAASTLPIRRIFDSLGRPLCIDCRLRPVAEKRRRKNAGRYPWRCDPCKKALRR